MVGDGDGVGFGTAGIPIGIIVGVEVGVEVGIDARYTPRPKKMVAVKNTAPITTTLFSISNKKRGMK